MFRDHYLLITALLVFLLPTFSPAQIAPVTDSLRNALEISAGESRIELLLELSDELRRSSRDSAITYAGEALEISQRIEHEALKAESHRKLGWLLIDYQNPQALEHLLHAKNSYEQLGDLQSEALTLKNLGDLYRSQSDYSKTLEYYFRALNLNERINKKADISNLLFWIGVVYDSMEQPEKSIEFYERALEINEQARNLSGIAMNATNLGEAYAATGETGRALELLNKALDASEQLPGAHAKATILISISSVYNSTQSYQQALKVNNEALYLARNMSDKMLESLALENIAGLYREQRDYSSANEYLYQALPLLEDIGWQQTIIEVKNRIARNHFDIQEFEQAIDKGEEALEMAMNVKAFAEGQKALELMSEAYRETEDYDKAIAAQKNILALKDSSFNREQTRQVAEMQARYETQKKEQEIAQLQTRQQKARFSRNAFAAGLLFIIIIGFLIYNRQRLKINKNQMELENNRLKEQKLKQDLEFKNKQLATHSLNLVQKNEVMKQLKESIHEIKLRHNGELQKKLTNLEHLVDYSFNLDKDWEEFKLYFEEIHSGFFETLQEQYPDLTTNELRLSALAKLNLSIKEIATILGISPNSVKTARYRLRKKLGMRTTDNLTSFMMNVEKDSMA